jgi:hypothetical protein
LTPSTLFPLTLPNIPPFSPPQDPYFSREDREALARIASKARAQAQAADEETTRRERGDEVREIQVYIDRRAPFYNFLSFRVFFFPFS